MPNELATAFALIVKTIYFSVVQPIGKVIHILDFCWLHLQFKHPTIAPWRAIANGNA